MKDIEYTKTRIRKLKQEKKLIRDGMRMLTDNLDGIDNANQLIDIINARIDELERVLN